MVSQNSPESGKEEKAMPSEVLLQRGLLSALPPDSSYPVTINFDLSPAEMVEVGMYDRVAEVHFLVNGIGNAEVATELVHFNREMSSEDVLRELKRQDMRPANDAELLAFGFKYPETQRQFSIVALVRLYEYENVMYLWGTSTTRGLGRVRFDTQWHNRFRFLAVRK